MARLKGLPVGFMFEGVKFEAIRLDHALCGIILLYWYCISISYGTGTVFLFHSCNTVLILQLRTARYCC